MNKEAEKEQVHIWGKMRIVESYSTQLRKGILQGISVHNNKYPQNMKRDAGQNLFFS